MFLAKPALLSVDYHQAVSTSRILLVPYEKHHVPTYHEWMQDKVSRLHGQYETMRLIDQEIQKATASEPLSLDEEYAMQRTWRQHSDKLTFISCRPLSRLSATVEARQHDSPEKMVGDVNLFLAFSDGEDGNGVTGEVELMIARRQDQGQGFGRATIVAFLAFVSRHEHDILQEYCLAAKALHGRNMDATSFEHLRVRIGSENSRSIHLFESLGFRKTQQEPNFFGEFELRLTSASNWRSSEWVEKFGIARYTESQYCP